MALSGWLIFNSAAPKNLLMTNVAARSLTLTWNTSRPSRGCVLAFEARKFLTISTYACDDHRLRLTSHHVSLSGLKPETNYRFLVRNGVFFKLISARTDKVSQTVPALPNPAYGQVLLEDGISPAKSVNVFVEINGQPKSAITNDTGGWSIDLGDIKDKKAFFLNADGAKSGAARKIFFLGEHQPAGLVRLEKTVDINPLSSKDGKQNSARSLFNRLSRTYFDAITVNLEAAKQNVKGVVFVKYDPDLDKTFVFAAVRNLPVVENKTVGVWLGKNISEYLKAGSFEFAAESGEPAAYSVFSAPGNLTGYDEVLVSYDKSAGVNRPESVVLRQKIPK